MIKKGSVRECYGKARLVSPWSRILDVQAQMRQAIQEP